MKIVTYSFKKESAYRQGAGNEDSTLVKSTFIRIGDGR